MERSIRLGARIGAGTLIVNALNQLSFEQIPESADPRVTYDTVLMARDVESMLFIAAVPEGEYTIAGSATGYASANVRQGVDPLTVVYTPLYLRPDGVRADINGDTVVNAVDVQLAILGALDVEIFPLDADVNGDGVVNSVDVQLVILAALQ